MDEDSPRASTSCGGRIGVNICDGTDGCRICNFVVLARSRRFGYGSLNGVGPGCLGYVVCRKRTMSWRSVYSRQHGYDDWLRTSKGLMYV